MRIAAIGQSTAYIFRRKEQDYTQNLVLQGGHINECSKLHLHTHNLRTETIIGSVIEETLSQFMNFCDWRKDATQSIIESVNGPVRLQGK